MRAKSFKLSRSVWRASTSVVIDEAIKTYTDTGERIAIVDDSETLAYRIAQAYSYRLDDYAIDVICKTFAVDYDSPLYDVITSANIPTAKIVDSVDVSETDYTPHVDGNDDDAHIVGYYWKTPKRGNPYICAARAIYCGEEFVIPTTRTGSLKFKSFGLSSLWALVKPIYRDYALIEAQALTKAHNTANTYHRVKYTLKPMDTGEAV